MVMKLDINDDMTLEQLAIAIADTIPKQILVNDVDRFQAEKDEVESFKRLESHPCCGWHLVGNYMSLYRFPTGTARTVLTIMINNLMDSLRDENYHDLRYLMAKQIRWAHDSLEEEIVKVLQNRYNTPESVDVLRKEAARERECCGHPAN